LNNINKESKKFVFVGKINSLQFRAWFTGMRKNLEDETTKWTVEQTKEKNSTGSYEIKTTEQLKLEFEDE